VGELIECVPNVSEAADQDLLRSLAAIAGAHAGVWLLDLSSDLDHGRSVFTLAGEPATLVVVMEEFVARALEGIDMRVHRGSHPCFGAVDVIPFVPLGGSSLVRCALLARAFGRRIAQRFGLPIYLYRDASFDNVPRDLAQLRRPGFGGLAEALSRPEGRPDFGPSLPHPTAGATAVGARPILIAYNIQLATADVTVARRIASAVRARDGGLPAVQALGIELSTSAQVQVSMNILDHERTPLWLVWETVGRLATAEGVQVLDSELVGLAPAAALIDVADHMGTDAARPPAQRVMDAGTWLRIRHFRVDMTLEARLAQARTRATDPSAEDGRSGTWTDSKGPGA
jgi:glutamate formiminotransferase